MMGATRSEANRNSNAPQRRGIATVWLIMSLPVLLAGLCLTIDVGKAWGERAALQNGVESAALAAVRQWRDEGASLKEPSDVLNAIQQGIDFAAANLVDSRTLLLTQNDSMAGRVQFEFGSIKHGQFCRDVEPNCNNGLRPAVRLTVLDYPLTSACGMTWTYKANAQAVAVATCGGRDVQLYSPTDLP